VPTWSYAGAVTFAESSGALGPLPELNRNRLRHDQATYLQNEITRWGNVIREKGIKGE
jgi:hypothetical protein